MDFKTLTISKCVANLLSFRVRIMIFIGFPISNLPAHCQLAAWFANSDYYQWA